MSLVKVVTYIVRGDAFVAFVHEEDDHPHLESGLQVPAGTVEPDEWTHVERDGGSGEARPFRLFWLPLSQARLLAGAQGIFLSRVGEGPSSDGHAVPNIG